MTEIEMSEILSEQLIQRDDGADNLVPHNTVPPVSGADDAANANEEQETAISGEDISYSARSFTAVSNCALYCLS